MKTLEELADEFVKAIPKDAEPYCAYCAKECFIAGAKSAEPRWVGVEERLPEPHQRVLIYDKSDAEPMIVDWRFNSTMGTQHWDGAGDVTHWQPLPKAPSPPSDGGE